jgi:hypothetical protein
VVVSAVPLKHSLLVERVAKSPPKVEAPWAVNVNYLQAVKVAVWKRLAPQSM